MTRHVSYSCRNIVGVGKGGSFSMEALEEENKTSKNVIATPKMGMGVQALPSIPLHPCPGLVHNFPKAMGTRIKNHSDAPNIKLNILLIK